MVMRFRMIPPSTLILMVMVLVIISTVIIRMLFQIILPKTVTWMVMVMVITQPELKVTNSQ